MKDDQMSAGLAAIDGTWQTLLPTLPITRHWLDDDFDQLFSEREKEGAIFAVFSGLTLGIACLGLFGLSAFAVRRDAKQIGLRRVFGASSSAIVGWELVRFSGLIVLACDVLRYE